MNAKEFLQQAYFLDRQADLLLKKSELLRKSLYGHGRSDTPCRSANSDGFSRTVAKVVDYEKKADELVRKLVNVRLEIETAVAKVPDSRQREVLERRYLLYQGWNEITESMNYSKSHVLRLHKSGLDEVKKMILNDTK